ncbi:unnamed protein product [Gemmata massiliana]|uniref:Uncharacterized protein n=1 Tax=Gemmata massiliana TaxID=1210884 RepID=A0A6P2CQH0_9BACT|nr:hypothetical protein [Gemmata massiliana]VTR91143.1 unnamed protein product [Gemmata massiliana]
MIRFNCPNCGRHYELLPALAFLPLVCKQCGERITPPAPDPEPPPPPPPPPAPVLQQPAAPIPTPKATLPVAKVVAPPAAKPHAPTDTAPPVAKPQPSAPPADDADDALATNSDSAPDIDFNLSGPTAANLSDAARALPPDGVNPAAGSELEGTAGSRSASSTTEKHTPPKIDLKQRAPKPSIPAPEPEVEERPEATLMPFIVDFVVFVLLVVVGMFVGEMLAQKTTGAVLSEAGSAPKFPPPDLLMWGGPPAVFALIYLLLSSRKLSVGEWLRRRRARSQ